jgi:hypothetical protein
MRLIDASDASVDAGESRDDASPGGVDASPRRVGEACAYTGTLIFARTA